MKMHLESGIDGEIGNAETTRPQTVFPGVTRLPGGELLALYTAGTDFESADQLPFYTISQDAGRHWSAGTPIFPEIRLSDGGVFSCCAKPTVRADGSIIALGYGFEREDSALSLSDYATQHGCFPRCRNFACFSPAGEVAWSAPHFIEHGYAGIETSGPALVDSHGDLHFFGPPFVLRGHRQLGLAFISRNGGVSWEEQSRYFAHADIAPWETRSCLLANGRIWLVFWAYDLAAEKHLNNYLVCSDDGGRTWSSPFDSGIHCQAANLLALPEYPGYMLLIGTVREGEQPGLMLFLLESDTGKCVDAQSLLSLRNMANAVGEIEAQFASLRFGQPGLLQLPDGTLLLSYWCKSGERYSCRWRYVTLRLQD